MKRNITKTITFLFIFILLVSVSLSVTAFLSACKKQDSEPVVGMGKVYLDEHVLHWDAVEGVSHYSLRVCFDDKNGYEIPVSGTEYVLKLTEAGTYTLYLRPVFNSGYGAYCDPITYVVSEESSYTPVEDDEDTPIILLGSGTYEDPLLIYTKEELATLTDGMREVEEHGETVKKQNYYLLKKDIDLSGTEWTSIGSSSLAFEGVFDGGGHTISGLTQTKLNGGSLKRNGLFSTLGNATIINLTLRDVDITIDSASDECRVGGLAGYSSGATVENCSVSGTITVNAPSATQKRCYVGMLVGYSIGTRVRRVTVSGDIDATFAGVYAGGVIGICTNGSMDNLDNVLSTVNVKAHGTGKSGSTPAGRAYAAGIAYLSSVENVSNCVWQGTAQASVIVGTPADDEMYAEGMFVAGGSHILRGECQIGMLDCFFDVEGIAYDQETYSPDNFATTAEWIAALADRYCVGNATKQSRRSAVFGFYHGNQSEQSTFAWEESSRQIGLDFEEVWIMEEGATHPTLRPYTSRLHTVRFVLDDGTEVKVEYVLHGETVSAPVYVGEDSVAVRWDFNSASPVTEDMTVHILAQ